MMDINHWKKTRGFVETDENICVFDGSNWNQWRIGSDQLPAKANFIQIESFDHKWKGTNLGLYLHYRHLLSQSYLILRITVDQFFDWSFLDMGDLLPNDSTCNEVLAHTAYIMEEVFSHKPFSQLGTDSFHIDLFSNLQEIHNLQIEIQFHSKTKDKALNPFLDSFTLNLQDISTIQTHLNHIARGVGNKDQTMIKVDCKKAINQKELTQINDGSFQNILDNFLIETEDHAGNTIIKKIILCKKVFGCYLLSFASGGETLNFLWNHRPKLESGMLLLIKY